MDTIKTLHGYTIKNGKLYLKGIYKGVPSWTTDYTYAKAYKTEKKALNMIEALERG